MRRDWTENEDNILRDNFGILKMSEIALLLNRNLGSVKSRAYNVLDMKRVKTVDTLFEDEIFSTYSMNYPMYEVSNYGKIRKFNVTHDCYDEVKTWVSKDTGYVQVIFQHNNLKKNYRVHRLVGELYVPNPDNLPLINHLDLNKEHNYFRNLEWSDSSSNTLHAISMGREGNSNRNLTPAIEREIVRLLSEEDRLPYNLISKELSLQGTLYVTLVN